MNATYSSNSTSNSDSITYIMNYFDIIARCVCLVTHSIYFLFVILMKDFQKLSYLNMHHTNFTGLLSGILYCAWINNTSLKFSDENLNDFLCSLSEFCWPVFRYARAYSLLALAIYRYLAVFHTNLFKKVSVSIKYHLFLAASCWIISIAIFIISKYSLNTTASAVMCVDGATSSLQISIVYYLITTIPAYVFPSILVIIIYIFIQNKLNSLSKNTRAASVSATRNQKRAKESKLALQLILLNIFNILSITSLMLVTLNRWVPVLDKNFYFLRQLWRVTNNLSQSVIPILSIIFHPSKLRCQNNIFCKTESSQDSSNAF